MIKFIHTGDIHLGLKFNAASFDREKAMDRRYELWSTFVRIVKYSVEINADFLLIAGDLFERDYFTLADIKRIRDILSEAKDVNVVIVAGNHDYIDSNSLYKKVDWSKNVTIFGSQGLEYKYFEESNTCVYGLSWERPEYRENKVFDEEIKLDSKKNNILLLHGDVSSTSKYLPISLDELRKLYMDYIALGHIHKPQIFQNNIAYCGSPEPLDFGEIGERGFVEGTIENGITEVRFVNFNVRSFREIDIRIKGHMGYMDILSKVRDVEGDKSRDFYRIYLKGYIQKDSNIEDLHRDLEKEFYHIEIVDETIPDYDLESLQEDNRDNIIGHFIKAMSEKDLENDINKSALYYGLEVLLKDRN